MSEEKQMSTTEAVKLLFNAARQLKLTFQEHQTIEQAAQIVVSELNNKSSETEE